MIGGVCGGGQGGKCQWIWGGLNCDLRDSWDRQDGGIPPAVGSPVRVVREPHHERTPRPYPNPVRPSISLRTNGGVVLRRLRFLGGARNDRGKGAALRFPPSTGSGQAQANGGPAAPPFILRFSSGRTGMRGWMERRRLGTKGFSPLRGWEAWTLDFSAALEMTGRTRFTGMTGWGRALRQAQGERGGRDAPDSRFHGNDGLGAGG